MRDTNLIIAAGLAAAAMLGLEHYALLAYWQSAKRTPMPVLVRYIIGVLALWGPFFVLVLHWATMTAADVITAICGITVIGGGAVIGFYGLDWLFAQLSLWRDRQPRQ